MAEASRDSEPRVARFFTPVRRIPLLIGKVGGQKLPFGPYTFMQLGIGATTLVVGMNTMALWGPLLGSSPITRLLALLIVSIGSVVLAASIPATKRKPHYVVSDAFGMLAGSGVGTYNGDPIRIAKPHQVTGVVLLADDHAPQPESHPAVTAMAPQRAAVAPPPPAGSAVAGSFQTGLDRLLEQARGGQS